MAGPGSEKLASRAISVRDSSHLTDFPLSSQRSAVQDRSCLIVSGHPGEARLRSPALVLIVPLNTHRPTPPQFTSAA